MVRLRFDTDLSTSLKASADLAAAVDKIGKSLNTSAKEATALEKAAKRIVDQNLTPLEKYTRQMDVLAKSTKTGKMSMEEAAVQAGRLRQRLDDTAGPAVLSGIAKMAAGYLSVGAAVGAVFRGLQQVEAQAQQSADRVLGSIGGFGELQQVATSPQDFQKLVGQARGLVSRGVFGPDQGGQAADFVFAMRNAGYTDDEMDFITQLGESKQVKPENMQKVAEGLKKFQTIFGAKQAGSIRAVGQKVFSAAGSMQTDFAQAATAATLFGSEAAALGYSDEEALAAFVAIEQQSPGAEEAATRLRGMYTQIQKGKLSKGTQTETFKSLIDRVHKGEAAIDIMGETRAAAGLNIIAGMEGQASFAQQTRDITAAQGQDLIGSRKFIETDPRLRAAAALQKAQGSQAETISGAYSEKEMLLELVNSTRARAASEKGTGAWLGEMIGQYTIGGLFDLFGGENVGIKGALQGNNLNESERALIVDYLKRIAENTGGTSTAPKPSGRQE